MRELLEELSGYRYGDTALGGMTEEIGRRAEEFDFLGAAEALDALEEKLSAATA